VAQVDTLLLTTPTLGPGNSCPPALEDIQGVLQTALPKIYWGVTYAGRGYTRLWFLGVSTGETATRTVEGSSGASWKIDLARFYFLHADGTLDSVWVALGFAPGDTSSSTTAIYSTFNDLPQAGWFSSHEALTRLSVPGQVFDIGFPDAFVDQGGIHWDQCRALARFIPGNSCDLGPILDPDGSAAFITSGITQENEILFGFVLTPNDQMTWLYPVPDAIDLPETCP